jgi:uncharacterized protein
MKTSKYNLWVEADGKRHVYNTISGKLISMLPEQWCTIQSFLAGHDEGLAEVALLQELVAGRAIINDDTDELELLRQRYLQTQRGTDRFHLTVVTSLGCNFDCPYCFEAKRPSLLDEDVQEKLLRLVDVKLASVERFTVEWFGGEPLVGKDALLRLSDEFIARSDAADVEYEATIITNGYLLTVQTARLLRDRRVTDAEVSIDGPEEIHDMRRPLVGGRGTFRKILDNVVAAADILPIRIRVNIDPGNAGEYERLLRTLADAGLAGRVTVHLGHIVVVGANNRAPSAGYETGCLTRRDFAETELRFREFAAALGFAPPALPEPIGAPCTAVRANELVIGSRGELYKCTQSVGNPHEVIGNLSTWPETNNRVLKWLAYDPFSDDDCRSCPALPVCMGGCALYSMDTVAHSARCETFQFNHHEEIRRHIERAGVVPSQRVFLPLI